MCDFLIITTWLALYKLPSSQHRGLFGDMIYVDVFIAGIFRALIKLNTLPEVFYWFPSHSLTFANPPVEGTKKGLCFYRRGAEARGGGRRAGASCGRMIYVIGDILHYYCILREAPSRLDAMPYSIRL